MAHAGVEAPPRWPVATSAQPDLPDTAGFGPRFGAWLLDQLFAIGLALIPGVTIAIVIGAMVAAGQSEPITIAEQQAQDDDVTNGAIAGFYLGFLPVYYLYLWIANAVGGGWGKRIVGLRVVGVMDREAPGFGRGFVRLLVSLFSGIFYLGYLWSLWDSEHRTWHDHASGTTVIETR
jgi:uncharacterized RDD family membrane protein YckC